MIDKETLQNEYNYLFLSKFFNLFFKKNPKLKRPSEKEFNLMKKAAIREMQDKYPDLGITLIK